MRKREEDLEQQVYNCQELEMKLIIQIEENNKNLAELSELKEEKRILYREKEEIKNDCSQLADKNSKLFMELEGAKQRQLELSSIISNYQKDLISSEEAISEHISNISSRDMELARFKEIIES